MQSKGAIKFVAILIALACLYQLSFTWANSHQEKKSKEYAEEKVADAKQNPAFSSVPELNKVFYLDSIYKERERFYLDSISSEKVFLGYTYKQVQDKEINLGLDLKGGMNIMLQVQLSDLVEALSDNNTSPEFVKALALARQREKDSREDFITLFYQCWKEVAPEGRLSGIFGTYELRDKIKPETSNDNVITVIRKEAESAIANSFNVLRNRIDRFGVTQPNIQRIGNTGRILVELPGVKEPERVRKLLQGTASLEFWPTYENSELYPYLQQANEALKDLMASREAATDSLKAGKKGPSAQKDTSKSGVTSAEEELLQTDTLSANKAEFAKNNPLFYLLNPNVYNGNLAPGPCIGRAHYRDTAKIDYYLSLPQIKAIFPGEFIPRWTVKASEGDKSGDYFELIAIKNNTRDGKAPLDGAAITDARISYGSSGGSPEVDMSMNAEGTRVWARLTADNLKRSIAVVLDGMVYSYPTVQTEITGGISSITGHFTIEEAQDLANVLKSGKLPAPATIVQEQVVGPSLGSESIHAGMMSFILAFLLVLIYMVFFYQGAGLVADVALLCNVLFLFGTLASFGAVLTLPGIAGLVLTMGMAVDANVIIFERTKEELRDGKNLKTAIREGYSNAYSAIIDGNLTTIITGIVLFLFGSGPVQGFATTLVIGIVTSLLTSIFITRLIFESRLSKNKNVSFDNKFSKNFLANTKVDFIRLRKIGYVFSSALIVICLSFILFRGFSYGVDFTGGRTYVVRFDKDVTAEAVRNAANKEFGGSVEVKQFGGNNQMKLTTKYKINSDSTGIDSEIEGKLYTALKVFYKDPVSLSDFVSATDNPNGIISSDKVGPTIAKDIQRDAVIAVILALIAIFIYIAIRFKNWSWGAGGLIALAHDTTIVVGFFAIFWGILPFTLDVDQTFIAAVLTIIGYSINDTVVIFDRIREYKRLFPKRSLEENVNKALNSTLARTVNTSGTTLIVMLAIAIFGGDVIRGFSVALIVGIVIGTYSSVFVATPLMYEFNKKRLAKEAESSAVANKRIK
ncbi:MAG: protein translocase subunit SecDF [Bacteroidales bacterium]|jgi:SecD/SecF fusion protein|nr:protein translocase subunit SecDF [Bacteroidales bacterium]